MAVPALVGKVVVVFRHLFNMVTQVLGGKVVAGLMCQVNSVNLNNCPVAMFLVNSANLNNCLVTMFSFQLAHLIVVTLTLYQMLVVVTCQSVQAQIGLS